MRDLVLRALIKRHLPRPDAEGVVRFAERAKNVAANAEYFVRCPPDTR